MASPPTGQQLTAADAHLPAALPAATAAGQAAAEGAGQNTAQQERWTCKGFPGACGTPNYVSRNTCRNCGKQRVENALTSDERRKAAGKARKASAKAERAAGKEGKGSSSRGGKGGAAPGTGDTKPLPFNVFGSNPSSGAAAYAAAAATAAEAETAKRARKPKKGKEPKVPKTKGSGGAQEVSMLEDAEETPPQEAAAAPRKKKTQGTPAAKALPVLAGQSRVVETTTERMAAAETKAAAAVAQGLPTPMAVSAAGEVQLVDVNPEAELEALKELKKATEEEEKLTAKAAEDKKAKKLAAKNEAGAIVDELKASNVTEWPKLHNQLFGELRRAQAAEDTLLMVDFNQKRRELEAKYDECRIASAHAKLKAGKQLLEGLQAHYSVGSDQNVAEMLMLKAEEVAKAAEAEGVTPGERLKKATASLGDDEKQKAGEVAVADVKAVARLLTAALQELASATAAAKAKREAGVTQAQSQEAASASGSATQTGPAQVLPGLSGVVTTQLTSESASVEPAKAPLAPQVEAAIGNLLTNLRVVKNSGGSEAQIRKEVDSLLETALQAVADTVHPAHDEVEDWVDDWVLSSPKAKRQRLRTRFLSEVDLVPDLVSEDDLMQVDGEVPDDAADEAGAETLVQGQASEATL